MKLGFLAAGAVAAIVAGLVIVTQVQAIGGSLAMGDASAAPGGTATATLTANVTADPGLGAWTVDITYDPSVATASDCSAEEGGVCNPDYDADSDPSTHDTVRITGASANGITDPNTVLGSIDFQCADAEGTSELAITISVFADATIGNPTDIDPADTTNGTLTCAVPAPTATAGAAGTTPTVAATALPSTGYGDSSGGDSNSSTWIIAILAGAGLAGIAGYGALRFRNRA